MNLLYKTFHNPTNQESITDTSQITFTRFIAAILIVVYHFGDQVYPFNNTYIKNIIKFSSLGVTYFFILSGFVMALAYLPANKINFSEYIWKRLARILPVYYLAIILMLIYYFIRINILGVASQYTPTVIDTLLNIFLIQSWFPEKATTINVAAWSLSAEFFFYFSFPFFFNYLYKKKPLNQIIMICGAIFAGSQIIFHLFLTHFPSHFTYFLYHPLLHITSFLAGNCLGLFFLSTKSPNKNLFFHILLTFLCSVAFLFLPWKILNFHKGIYLIFFIPLIYFIAADKSWISRIFRNKKLIYLGEISYGIYILQFPVYLFFTAGLTFIGYKINQPLFYVYLILLLIISAISYELIEKPLRMRIRKFFIRSGN